MIETSRLTKYEKPMCFCFVYSLSVYSRQECLCIFTLKVERDSSAQTLTQTAWLKGLFTSFEYITFFSCLNKRNILYERCISIKQLEVIAKVGCSKSGQPSTIICIIYITRTDYEPHFSPLFRVRVVFHRDGPFIEIVSLWRQE